MKLVGYYNYTVIATYLGAVSAVCGIIFAAGGNAHYGVFCLMLAGFLDMFDGRIASTMKRNDEEKMFGIQIDSLCDLVSFGVLPAVIGWSIGLRGPLFVVIASLYVVNAVIRLAYFNVDEALRQKAEPGHRKYYLGCPVTAAALLFPLIFGLQKFLPPEVFPIVYEVFLAVTALAFVSGFRIKKPGKFGIGISVLIGLAEIYLVFSL